LSSLLSSVPKVTKWIVLPLVDPDMSNSRYPLILEPDFQTWQDLVVSENAPKESPIIPLVNAVLAVGCYIYQSSPGIQKKDNQAQTYLSIALRARENLVRGLASVEKVQASFRGCCRTAKH
jgi:hypothetical protein